jgi:hypothetical protein
MSARLLLLALVLSLGCGGADAPTPTFASISTDADRKAAMAQKVCPVTDERLFSMGTPIKASAGGRSFFLCCANCEDDAAADFDEYFAKVKPGADN